MTITRTRRGCTVETRFGKTSAGDLIEHVTLSCEPHIAVAIIPKPARNPYDTQPIPVRHK